MKKGFGIFALLFVSLLFLSSFVIAQVDLPTPEEVQSGVAESKSYIAAFINGILGPAFDSDGSQLFTKIIFVILLCLLIYEIVDVAFKPHSKFFTGLISLVISILGVMFLPTSFIVAIRDQYGILGATILSVIPFIILLLFSVRAESTMVGRVVWLFYTIYYFALYLYRIFGDSNPLSWNDPSNWPYWGAIIAGIIMFVFIVKIHEIVFKEKMTAIEDEAKKIVKRGNLLHRYEKDATKALGPDEVEGGLGI